MKLVILGAGASKDSYYDLHKPTEKAKIEWRPPLGNELFNLKEYPNFKTILDNYPGAKSLSAEINLEKDIEVYFQRKWEQSLKNNDKLLQSKLINIQFYLADLLTQISINYDDAGYSSYDVILEKAYSYHKEKSEDVVFVSFNYDTLLENSLERMLKTNISKIENYITGPIKIIKPHGSCNWFAGFVSPFPMLPESVPTLIQYYLYHLEKGYNEIDELTNDQIVLKQYSNNISSHGGKGLIGFIPKLLIPLKEKDDFTLPQDHLICLEKHLSKVTDILIIGWKGTEQKFLNLLRDKVGTRSIPIQIVNMDDSITNVLKNVMPNCQPAFHKSSGGGVGFIDFLRNGNTFFDF